MEIDVLSPQMCIRSISNKRSRSPDSPSPLERASKRPVLIHRESISELFCNIGASEQQLTAGSRRSVHEDEWVYQTRGMRIHSPTLDSGDRTPGSSDGSLIEDFTDVQMSGPEEISRLTFVVGGRHEKHAVASAVPPSAAENPPPTSSTTSQSDFHSLQAPPPATSLHLPTPNDILNLAMTQPHSAPPRITLHPATPSTPSDGHRMSYIFASSRASTPPPMQSQGEAPSSPMSIIGENCPSSPLSSHSRTSAQRRKAIFSMGPRADCDKCRMKVPGHWNHVDQLD